jgi:hypothetical protein
MVSELDSRITSQLVLHRGLHSLARPLMAILRDMLMAAKLQNEVNNLPPNLQVAQALEALDRWHEIAEKVDREPT